SDDLLVGHYGVVDLLAVKIAIAHHLVAAEDLGVEREGAIHVLDRNTEVLHSLEAGAERSVVAVCRDGSLAGIGGAPGERRGVHYEGAGSNAADCGAPCSPQDIPAIRVHCHIDVCGLVGHDSSRVLMLPRVRWLLGNQNFITARPTMSPARNSSTYS